MSTTTLSFEVLTACRVKQVISDPWWPAPRKLSLTASKPTGTHPPKPSSVTPFPYRERPMMNPERYEHARSA